MTDMTDVIRRPLAVVTALAMPFALLPAAPAAAQNDSETVRFVTVVGEEECPQSTDDEIVVCNRYNQDDQYRVPEALRGDPDDPKEKSWAQRAATMDEVSEAGALSCSPEGLGGYTGCTQEMIEAYYGNKDKASAGRASEIINATRDERLADIDAEAEAEEARVQEAIERQKALREKRDAEAGMSGDSLDDQARNPEPLAVPPEDVLDAQP